MSPRRQALWLRRLELVNESTRLRDRMAVHACAVGPVFQWADQLRSGVQWLKVHPWVPALAGFLLLWRRPRTVWRWGSRLWAASGLLRRAIALWQAFSVKK
jgi:hypothetical protein